MQLLRNTNQARGLGEYALAFLKEAQPSRAVLQRVKLFHTDSVLCGLSALALNTPAPKLLREEALRYKQHSGAKCFGSDLTVAPEKAVVANSSAVREWDANGTVFGYASGKVGRDKGEYGHNDFYPVCVAAAQLCGLSGADTLKGMLLVDEIRGRLCEVVPLRHWKVDHVLHGGIAAAVTYGAMLGCSVDQIENAVGMLASHYVPFRSIRHGAQLSDSKGTSAAFISEQAVLSVHRAINGFEGPKDIFRNSHGVFGVFGGSTADASCFDLELQMDGLDFAVMGMHFKLGVYEHQSASAVAAVTKLLQSNSEILSDIDDISQIEVLLYKDALGIIGQSDRMNCATRQSSEHSMYYIIATLLRKAMDLKGRLALDTMEELWCQLMLNPYDYSEQAIFHGDTRKLMAKVTVKPGGDEYERQYPEGIPTSVRIHHKFGVFDSGLVLFPPGHANNSTADFMPVLTEKFKLFGNYALEYPITCIEKLQAIDDADASEMQDIYAWRYKVSKYSI